MNLGCTGVDGDVPLVPCCCCCRFWLLYVVRTKEWRIQWTAALVLCAVLHARRICFVIYIILLYIRAHNTYAINFIWEYAERRQNRNCVLYIQVDRYIFLWLTLMLLLRLLVLLGLKLLPCKRSYIRERKIKKRENKMNTSKSEEKKRKRNAEYLLELRLRYVIINERANECFFLILLAHIGLIWIYFARCIWRSNLITIKGVSNNFISFFRNLHLVQVQVAYYCSAVRKERNFFSN